MSNNVRPGWYVEDPDTADSMRPVQVTKEGTDKDGLIIYTVQFSNGEVKTLDSDESMNVRGMTTEGLSIWKRMWNAGE
jgi:hypothetical protein